MKRRQTPPRKQAPTALSTPSQMAEKTDTQTPSQVSLRRSTRERRLTEHSQPASIEQETPCRQKTSGKASSVTSDPIEESPATNNRKSRVVRLRLHSLSTHPGDDQMSFTGSFSHRQKSSQEPDSQASRDLDASFVENRSFQDPGPETFAQPQPEPILADSQDLYSSQLGPDDGKLTSIVAAHLQEQLQDSRDEARERFSTSSWIARQDQQAPVADLRSEGVQQQRGVQEAADNTNASWQTQATIPWCPPWNAPSPKPTQQAQASVSFHASQATTIDEMPIDAYVERSSLSKQELREIADKLLAHCTYGPPKPEPKGHPTVWADARMDLCETLHYFRSYQGACHSIGGFVRGFMFDKVAHARDYMDDDVVIARAGGGQVKDKGSGELKASGDQVEGNHCQNLRNCMAHYNPVVIITGADNPHIPSQPPHQYCVLDYFKPTHIWTEKSGKSNIIRYRFEKLNARKASWWSPKTHPETVSLGSLLPPHVRSCGTCAKESTQIYVNGWMCLSPTCPSFWLILPSNADSPHTSPREPDEAGLIYDPRFLKAHTPWPNDSHEYPLKPSTVSLFRHAVPGEDTSEAFVRGVVCPSCGRCTPRLSWIGWECSCSWTYTPPHTLIPALSIRDPLWPLSDAYTCSRDIHSPLVRVSVSFAHGYRVNRYIIPGIEGFVTHMIANQTVVQEPGGPDEMFEDLQGMDIGLRRRPLEGGMLKGGMFTRHFAVNYGMPYNFIAATESHPFPEASHPVSAARSRLNWAARHCLARAQPSSASSSPSEEQDEGEAIGTSTNSTPALRDFEQRPFNEVLALCYFESQRISYHDDGESGLGPTIATLSLGSPGTMRLRLKAKHHLGVSNAGVYTDAPPLPGCLQYESRRRLVAELQALKSAVSATEYRKRLKEIPRDLGSKASGNARDVLTMKVGHGDVVVMHGAELQRYYEHSVDHAGKLRFALTCRYIDPDSLSASERPDYEVGPDEGGYDGSLLGQESQGEGAVSRVDEREVADSAMDHSLRYNCVATR
ncbi:hypothetical protein E8E12_002666 [Didymella heteroderae]|uniref:Alpha-ketoglutarate-dependent dioxygenase AlkB-like domain-containing protein n=1 Tax=Didymella heteroderae TaxID=1769908 RepID=A0A9P4WIZ2_9PLEO|nr:hypothetical protein E8E12_002666 [Didymella heteroderae]